MRACRIWLSLCVAILYLASSVKCSQSLDIVLVVDTSVLDPSSQLPLVLRFIDSLIEGLPVGGQVRIIGYVEEHARTGIRPTMNIEQCVTGIRHNVKSEI